MLTRLLADFGLKLNYSLIPEEAVKEAKRSILDGLGVVVAGSISSVGKIINNYVSSAGGNCECAVVGTGIRCSAPNAALAMGTMGHALDYDDSSVSLYGHPTVTILPVVIAIGEKIKASGKEMLVAFIAGVEAVCKIGKAANPDHFNRGFHPTSTIGVIGATVATGRLLGLSEEELSNGLGIAGSLSSGLQDNFGTMTKPLHAGFAAQHGIISAILAKKGITSSMSIFEGYHGFFNAFVGKVINPIDIGKNLGNPFDLVNPGIMYKLYPSCSRTQAAINGLLKIINKYQIAVDQIESIKCGTDEKAHEILTFKSPKTGDEGKFSMEFCLAIACVNRMVSIDDFCKEKLENPQILKIMERINMFVDPKIVNLGYEKRSSVSIRVKLVDGSEHAIIHFPKGCDENPVSDDELIEKYRRCSGLVLEKENVEQSLDLVLNLESVDNICNIIKVFTSGLKRV